MFETPWSNHARRFIINIVRTRERYNRHCIGEHNLHIHGAHVWYTDIGKLREIVIRSFRRIVFICFDIPQRMDYAMISRA